MKLPRLSKRALVLLSLLALLAAMALLSGCGTGDLGQNTFAAEGDVARKQRDILIYWVLGPAAAIFIVVEALVVYAVIRYRRKKDDGIPTQVHGNTRMELAWTIAPTILLLVLAVPVVQGVADLGRSPRDDALHIRVTGLQWRWQFEYVDEEYLNADGEPLRLFDEVHIPTEREIGLEILSADVIHSFWVPRLAGKQDAIPGSTRHMWLNADRPGSYSGQCAEFCGLQHGDMRMVMVAQEESEFEEWIQGELADEAGADGSDAAPDGSDEGASGE
jgi:cytochrome c oxidase subunit 2